MRGSTASTSREDPLLFVVPTLIRFLGKFAFNHSFLPPPSRSRNFIGRRLERTHDPAGPLRSSPSIPVAWSDLSSLEFAETKATLEVTRSASTVAGMDDVLKTFPVSVHARWRLYLAIVFLIHGSIVDPLDELITICSSYSNVQQGQQYPTIYWHENGYDS